MPLVIKFRDVEHAIRIIIAMDPALGDVEAEEMREEYNEQGSIRCYGDGGDKFLMVAIVKEGDIALTTVSGHQESLDVTERFCRRIGAEYRVE